MSLFIWCMGMKASNSHRKKNYRVVLIALYLYLNPIVLFQPSQIRPQCEKLVQVRQGKFMVDFVICIFL